MLFDSKGNPIVKPFCLYNENAYAVEKEILFWNVSRFLFIHLSAMVLSVFMSANTVIFGSGNGLTHTQRQAIAW